MATWDGYNTTLQANRLQKTFVIDYIDLSGRLCIREDTSMNNRLFVMNDASFVGNMYIDDNITTNQLIVNGDASLNNRLFVMNDASFVRNMYIDDNVTINRLIVNGDASLNNRLLVMNDASFVGNMYIDEHVILNGNLTVNGDATLNSNVVIYKDLSNNGNNFIGRDLTVLGNIAIQNYTGTNIINTTTTNYRLAILEDISLNGRLSVSSDASINGSLYVKSEINVKSTAATTGLMDICGSRIRTFISATGNVGVGTTTPTAPLHVISSGDTNPHTNGLHILSANTANSHSQIYMTTPIGGGNPMVCYEVPNKVGWCHGVDNADKNYKFSNSSSSLTSATKMTIQPDTGYVGIGTTNPSSFLHIYGNALTSHLGPADFDSGTYHNLLLTNIKTTDGSRNSLALGVDPSFCIGYINFAKQGSNNPVCLQSRGGTNTNASVGIGMTNPAFDAKLHVNGNIKIGSSRSIIGFASGNSTQNTVNTGTESYGVTFPSVPIVIAWQNNNATANRINSVSVYNETTTGFSFSKTFITGTTGGNISTGTTFSWMAVLLS